MAATTKPPAPLPPFLHLPAEIRLEIYSLLLHTQPSSTLQIRTLPATQYSHPTSPTQLRRTSYRYIIDRMRSRTAESTYYLFSESCLPIHTAILSTNKLINSETTHLLYSSHTFDFGLDIESIVPFLRDLTPIGRRSLRRISLTRRALPYTKDFDRSEWASTCAHLAAHLSHTLTSLDLNVFGGVPAARLFSNQLLMQIEGEEEEVGPYTREDFEGLVCGEEMLWATQLAAVRGVREVRVKGVMEICPVPRSRAMAFFVGFSRSIEGGFRKWLRGLMVEEKVEKERMGRGEVVGEGWSFKALD